MALCEDKRITYLRDYGYNVVALPRTGIRPLTVAVPDRRKTLRELGYLPDIWTSQSPVPQATGADNIDLVAANIEGQSTDKLDAKVGLGVLKNLTSALGFNGAEVGAKYEAAESLSFRFSAIERHKIDPLRVGSYLMEGELQSGNPFVKRFFAPSLPVFLVTETLLSNSFEVAATESDGTALDIDVPALQDVVDVELGLKAESTGMGTVSWEGPTKLPFAFVAAQLKNLDGEWQVDGFPKPGTVHLSDEREIRGVGEVGLHGGVVFESDGLIPFEGPR